MPAATASATATRAWAPQCPQNLVPGGFVCKHDAHCQPMAEMYVADVSQAIVSRGMLADCDKRRATESAPARRSISPEVVLAVAALGVFMEFVDSTIVNIAFPAIHRSFAATTISTLSWVLNAYSIVFAAFLVVSGRLADLFGRRRLFRLGVVVFTGASALCGIAPNPAFLIGMRALQALGGAMVVPSSMALVIEAYPVARRARATTIYGATAALAAALGPPIGGALDQIVDLAAVLLHQRAGRHRHPHSLDAATRRKPIAGPAADARPHRRAAARGGRRVAHARHRARRRLGVVQPANHRRVRAVRRRPERIRVADVLASRADHRTGV